jgi:queuine tRNA-ribosyltransferase
MFFELDKKSTKSLARAGIINTKKGSIKTPAFVPVGTKATVKSITVQQLEEAKTQAMLANTYHLYLQPGEKIIKESGGLSKFSNWQGPTMTDSGGFQAFSLGVAYGHGLGKFVDSNIPNEEDLIELTDNRVAPKKAKVTEEGVEFASIIDGSQHFMSPEKSIQIQKDIGADIIFALDEFTSPHADFEKIKETIERTERWAKRCINEFKITNSKFQTLNLTPQTSNLGSQALFGIVQGGRQEELRKMSAKQISALEFDGFGIGGTFVKEDMATAVRWVNEILPEEKPRHLLGVGEPIDMILGVENGCDTFDCVAPTRMARNGGLHTKYGKISITNAKYKNDLNPIEDNCNCYTCKNYSKAYLSHLFRAKEMLGATLATIHNIYFLNDLMEKIRDSILNEKFDEFKEEFIKNFKI